MTSRLVVIPTRRAHSNHAEVARSIGIDIIAGRYAEGGRLPGDAELTAMFGVSRPVLRESVKTLVAKGLLTTKARVGTVVRERGAWNMFDADVLAWHLDAGIDRRFLNDLAEIRLAVEPRAAALAAGRRSEADIAELRRSMARMRAEASDSVGFADGDLALHLAVANASGNLFMRSIGNVIEAALRASFLLSAPVETQDRETVLSWHQRIVDAIESGDAEAATAAMIEVIHNGLRRHEGAPASSGARLRIRGSRVWRAVMSPLRVAIVGFGKIARDQHVPAIAATDGVELVAVASRNASLPGVPHAATLDELLRDGPPIDAVALCTPPQVRHAQAAMALAAGKHVMLEKPPGATVAEITPLVTAARAAQRTLFATWHSRFAPAVEPARQLLAGRQVTSVKITWKEDVRVWHPGQAWIFEPGGLGVFDPGINALSILTRILPQPLFVTSADLAFPANRDAPIAATLALSDAQGLKITAEFDFLQTGPQSWDIDLDTDGGPVTLSMGGARLRAGGKQLVDAADAEYAGLYRRFRELCRNRRERRRSRAASTRRRRVPAGATPHRRAIRGRDMNTPSVPRVTRSRFGVLPDGTRSRARRLARGGWTGSAHHHLWRIAAGVAGAGCRRTPRRHRARS